MQFSLQQDDTLLFQEINPFLAVLLATPFQKKDLGNEFLSKYFSKKLYEQNPEFSTDWKEYVEPELSSLFASCHEAVLADLTRMHESLSQDTQARTLTIRRANREAWLRMLSMVRLWLAAQHQFTNEELDEQKSPSITTPRGQALLQMHLFAIIQQSIIEVE